jgi:hypothetical protein
VKRCVRHHPRNRRGFVLVLTLAMLLVAVTMTARSANRSLTRTMQSLEAESLLQGRWQKLSLQHAILGRDAGAVGLEFGEMVCWALNCGSSDSMDGLMQCNEPVPLVPLSPRHPKRCLGHPVRSPRPSQRP